MLCEKLSQILVCRDRRGDNKVVNGVLGCGGGWPFANGLPKLSAKHFTKPLAQIKQEGGKQIRCP